MKGEKINLMRKRLLNAALTNQHGAAKRSRVAEKATIITAVCDQTKVLQHISKYTF